MVFCNLIWRVYCYCGMVGHNPYFNRWFSAIVGGGIDTMGARKSQSLF